MAKDWAAVDELMRELGSVRRVAGSLRAEESAQLALDRAILEAAEAVERTIDGPNSHERLGAAREAIGVAIEVVLALDAEIGRSLRIRSRAATLSAQAAALIERANRDQLIRFVPSRPHGHERIAQFLNPLAQAGYVVKVGSAAEADTWRIAVEKGTRALAFNMPKAASATEWEEAVRRVMGQ